MAKTGRPSIDDTAMQAALADYMLDHPNLTATEAFRERFPGRNGQHSEDSARRRVVTKFNKDRERLMATAVQRAARRRAATPTPQPSIALPINWHLSGFDQVVALLEHMTMQLPGQQAIAQLKAQIDGLIPPMPGPDAMKEMVAQINQATQMFPDRDAMNLIKAEMDRIKLATPDPASMRMFASEVAQASRLMSDAIAQGLLPSR